MVQPSSFERLTHISLVLCLLGACSGLKQGVQQLDAGTDTTLGVARATDGSTVPDAPTRVDAQMADLSAGVPAVDASVMVDVAKPSDARSLPLDTAPDIAACTNATVPDQCASGCVNLASDPKNCGTCGRECTAPNATGSCVARSCRFACTSGYADCDQAPGCEAFVMGNDRNRCGSCNACPAGDVCSGGRCVGCVNDADCDAKNPDPGTRSSKCNAKHTCEYPCRDNKALSCDGVLACTVPYAGYVCGAPGTTVKQRWCDLARNKYALGACDESPAQQLVFDLCRAMPGTTLVTVSTFVPEPLPEYEPYETVVVYCCWGPGSVLDRVSVGKPCT